MRLMVLGCSAPYPEAGGMGPGYLVSSDSGQTHLLLDCGPGVLSKMLSHIPLESLDALILSHLHYDHMSDALPMQYALAFSTRQNLTLIAPPEPENVARLFLNARYDVYPPSDQRIGELSVSFVPVNHPVMAYAVCVEENGRRLVYTGDTNECEALELFADQADLLLMDCGLSEADWKKRSPHLSAKRCGALATRVRAKNVVLTHLAPRYDRDALLTEAQAECPRAELAYPGLWIDL